MYDINEVGKRLNAKEEPSGLVRVELPRVDCSGMQRFMKNLYTKLVEVDTIETIPFDPEELPDPEGLPVAEQSCDETEWVRESAMQLGLEEE